MGTPKWRSGLERDCGEFLERLGVEFKFEPHTINYTLPDRKYLPDFLIGQLYIETKGRFKPEDRRKMLAVMESNPGLKLLMVFSRPELTIAKRSKTTYAEWCTKHGIAWASLEDFKKEIQENADCLFARK